MHLISKVIEEGSSVVEGDHSKPGGKVKFYWEVPIFF